MHLSTHQLERVQCYKYLGLLLSHDLNWSAHIQSTCSKAKKILGLLYQQFSNNTNSEVMAKVYLSLVRPHLEYGAQVWNPYLAKDRNALENVHFEFVQDYGMNVMRSYLTIFTCHLWKIGDFTCHCLLFLR